MSAPEPIRLRVDPTNPGQLFACCGLFELADRLWGGAEAWFDPRDFYIRPLKAVQAGLETLLTAVTSAGIRQTDDDDDYASSLDLLGGFQLRLDWWKDTRAGGDRLKVWAGSMRSVRIARAMQQAIVNTEFASQGIFDHGMVVYDPLEPDKKVEPFYFDARRGSSARPVDVGFSPDGVQMTTTAYPSVEFLCLVGLQRFRPKPTATRRIFEYSTWTVPLEPCTAMSAVWGLLPHVGGARFRFEVAFRTDQRKHKAFTSATQLSRS